MPTTATWRQFEALIVALLAPMVATDLSVDLPPGQVTTVFSVLNADVAKTKGMQKPFIAVAFQDWTVTKTSVSKPVVGGSPKFRVLEEGHADFDVLIYAASGSEKGEARLVAYDLLDPVRNLLLGARIAFAPNGTGFDNAPIWPILRRPGMKEGFLDADSKAGVVVCLSQFYAGAAIKSVA